MKDPRFVYPEGYWSTGLTEAIRLRAMSEDRPPTDDDRRVSTFPMTKAARVALDLSREKRRA